MAFTVISDLGNLFYNMFGSGVVLALVIIFMMVMLLLAVRASVGVIIATIIPVLLGFVLATKTTNFIYVSAWIYIPILLIAAIMFGMAFISSIRG